MELNRNWVNHQRGGQSMTGYLVAPAMVKEPLPAVLVIQEIWGPDEHIQDVADRVAQAGYLALAPDLYSRGGRPQAMSAERIAEFKAFMDTVPPATWHDPSELAKALQKRPKDEAQRIQETQAALFGPKDSEGMVQDLRAWIDFLEKDPHNGGKPVGSTGYCMGGALSFQLALAEPRLKVAMVYYGTAPDKNQLGEVKCPVFGFYGGEDHRISDQVPEVRSQMKSLGKTYEAKVYEGAGHAFFNDSRISYHVGAARDAWAKTLAYFNQYLA